MNLTLKKSNFQSDNHRLESADLCEIGLLECQRSNQKQTEMTLEDL